MQTTAKSLKASYTGRIEDSFRGRSHQSSADLTHDPKPPRQAPYRMEESIDFPTLTQSIAISEMSCTRRHLRC